MPSIIAGFLILKFFTSKWYQGKLKVKRCMPTSDSIRQVELLASCRRVSESIQKEYEIEKVSPKPESEQQPRAFRPECPNTTIAQVKPSPLRFVLIPSR